MSRLGCLVLCLYAITTAAAEPPSPDLVAATAAKLLGTWQCAGAFANGKPIESQMTFESVLGGKWISYRHDDRPPNRYAAIGLWGKGTSHPFEATIFDNFGGHRLFVSEGWIANALTLENAADPAKRQRFIFSMTDDGGLRMEYRVSRDGGEWTLGDYLNCKR